jgi:hypothetical protein
MMLPICSCVQPPIISFLLGPNVLLTILFSSITSVCSLRELRDKFHTHENQQAKLCFF